MEIQEEKVHVTIGTDPQEGFGTLKWTLKKWSSCPISIVILHAANNTSKDYIYTSFGKVSSAFVNDEKVEDIRKIEERLVDKILSHYIASCGMVQAEVHKIKKYDEPIHKILVNLISELRITKLVMSITSVKSPTWKSRNAIDGALYVQSHKSDFCELHIVCEGKLVYLREEYNGVVIEDDRGVMVAKIGKRNSFRSWIGRWIPDSDIRERNGPSSPSSSTINDTPDQWEKFAQEIENYFLQLSSSGLDEEDGEVANDNRQSISPKPDIPENLSAAEKIEALKIGICKAQETIQLSKKEAKANADRCAKAQWAISICTQRAAYLEGRVKEEIANRNYIKKDLARGREEIDEILSEIEEKKRKLNSILELRHQLSNKLQISSAAKSQVKSHLEKAVRNRMGLLKEIEEMRNQRNVLYRRIKFCKDKDGIRTASRFEDRAFHYKIFTAEEIRAATNNFSERLRLKSTMNWTNVYKGWINHTTVAIKLYGSVNGMSPEAFQTKVKILSEIQHPHLLSMIGFSTDLTCVVFEYMENGCLRDTLFSSRRRNQGLSWHSRIRIAAEVGSALGFLHQHKPNPMIHGNLNPSKVLLNGNNVSKISGFRVSLGHDGADMRSDMRSFGSLILQLLSGRNWAGIVYEVVMMDRAALSTVLDRMAGEWPLDLAVQMSAIAVRCLSTAEGEETELRLSTVLKEISKVKAKANDLVASKKCSETNERGLDMDDSSNVPNIFFCPIIKDVMESPHVAADGFSYELGAIEEWLNTGHDTSPVTNLRLKHRFLTPNHTFRSLIQDWRSKRLVSHG